MKQLYLLLGLLLSFNICAADSLNFSNPRIPEAPPGASVMAAYMEINNTGNEQIDIIDIKSPSFKSIEMHLSKEVDGFAKMLPQKQLSIPANGKLILEPGGYHLMLIKPSKWFKQGEKIKLNFTLSNNESIKLEVSIKKTRSRGMKCAAGKCGGM
ncbi:MAG: copper chaperone PCu(A)C [Gammaproteobacteria bacterium]|nr:copper chaperone PCu(A)C [Gammaproteobacteria bacterium]